MPSCRRERRQEIPPRAGGRLPSPTETFVERGGVHKFRAIELNENSGIYVKVIAPCIEGRRRSRKVGDEVFITGREQMIYFPRPEHAIVRYGEQTDSPRGGDPRGRGALRARPSGRTRPPRARGRRSSSRTRAARSSCAASSIAGRSSCGFWQSRRAEAQREPRRAARERTSRSVPEKNRIFRCRRPRSRPPPTPGLRRRRLRPQAELHATTHDRPDTRYDGAVSIAPHTGYAVEVVSKTACARSSSRRHPPPRVRRGPPGDGVSTGTPKSDAKVERTVYLRTLQQGLRLIEAGDGGPVSIRIRLSYRVNFEGDPSRWFSVENYVKFLTEHLRSLVRAAVKSHRVQGAASARRAARAGRRCSAFR